MYKIVLYRIQQIVYAYKIVLYAHKRFRTRTKGFVCVQNIFLCVQQVSYAFKIALYACKMYACKTCKKKQGLFGRNEPPYVR